MSNLHKFLAIAALASGVGAQIPDGSYVVSTRADRGFGGLSIFGPRTGQVRVSGLPTELTGSGAAFVGGATCIEIPGDDGTLIVGEGGPAGIGIELHRVRIVTTGSTATATVLSKTTLGTSQGPVRGVLAGVQDMTVLPGGDIVAAVSGLVSGPPLNGERLVRFSPRTGALTPIVTNAAAGFLESVACDPSGQFLYFHVRPTLSPTQGNLYRCPVAGGSVTVVRRISNFRSMTVDARGHIHAVSNTFFFELTPTGQIVRSGGFNARTEGVAVEWATQRPIYLVGDPSSPVATGVYIGSPSTLRTQAIPLHSTGLAIKQSPAPYGQGTAGSASFAFAPQASAAPRAFPGNSAFAVRIDASDQSKRPGFLLVSASPANTQLLGVNLLVDLANGLLLGPIMSGTAVPLPLPNNLSPGLRVFLQGAFTDPSLPNRVATSNGLLVGVIQ